MIEVVCEIGINHNGSVEIAKKLIDVAYSAGCHYVKFQKRTIDLVYTQEELDKPRESPWGMTNRQQKYGLEFGPKEYAEIDEYCEGRIKWFASPWDEESIDFLARFDVPFIKIPSALAVNAKFIRACQKTNKKLIISTGGCDEDDVFSIVTEFDKWIYAILHCTATYPSKPEEQNLLCLEEMIKDFAPAMKVGFSNHYSGLMAMIMAACLGAEMLEFHITLDRTMYGSDQAASIEPQGVFRLMEALRMIEQMRGDGIKQVFEREIPIMEKLRR